MALSRITNPFLSSSGAGNASITSPSANTIAFSTTTTERMRIDSAGNIGIGTATPASYGKLAVNDTGAKSIYVRSSTTNFSGLLLENTNSATKWQIGVEGGFYNTAGLLNIGIDAVGPKLTIDSNGLVTIASGQIKFPATQNASSDANTLDDYEEGTWTPTITSSSGTITSYTSTGFYVKIGKQVTVWCNVKVTNVGTGTGSVSISSMPFTVNATDLFGIVAFGRETDITGVIWQGWSTSGGNGFNVLTAANGGLIGTNYRYVGSVTYTV